MPLYTYKCPCGNVFESIQKMNSDPPPCPKCGEPTKKMLTGTKLKFSEPWRPLGKRIY